MPELPVLRTERLRLRPFQPGDAELLHSMWTDPFVRRYLWDDVVIPVETVHAVLVSHRETTERARIGYWVILDEPAGQPAGFCGFRFIGETPDIELMYGLLPHFCGRGLATEASRSALDYLWAETPFDRVYARTDPPNGASVGVMRRLGMTHHSSTAAMITYFLDRPPRPPETP